MADRFNKVNIKIKTSNSSGRKYLYGVNEAIKLNFASDDLIAPKRKKIRSRKKEKTHAFFLSLNKIWAKNPVATAIRI